MKTVQVVVNVDDLGLHPAVTTAVLEGSQKGIISSTSLLANMEATELAAKKVTTESSVGIGIHLNILRGRPLLNQSHVKSLVNSNGQFLFSYPLLYLRYLSGHLQLDEVEKEWRAQIEKVINLGVPVTHLDAEKHIHCWPKLFDIVIQLAREYGISWVRRIREDVEKLVYNLPHNKARLLNYWQKPYWSQSFEKVFFADRVWGVARPGKWLQLEKFISYASSLKGGSIIELICHPGFLRGEALSEEVSRMNVSDHWSIEYDRLTGLSASEFEASSCLKLAHFGSLNMTGKTDQGL